MAKSTEVKEKKPKRGPKELPLADKKMPLKVSAKLRNHPTILAKIEPIIQKMDK